MWSTHISYKYIRKYHCFALSPGNLRTDFHFKIQNLNPHIPVSMSGQKKTKLYSVIIR